MLDVRKLELDEIDSTNAYALRLAAAGERGPLWIRANAQSAGRGRKGRHWVSKPGNLYTTLLISLDAPPASLSQLSFVTSLAVFDLATYVLGSTAELSLKWPNDVLLAGQKLSGILAETVSTSQTDLCTVAIGCGVNLQHSPGDTRYGATSLASHGKMVEPVAAWPHFIESMSNWLDIWQGNGGFEEIRQAWTDRSRQIGTTISLDLGDTYASGLFEGLASDGALMLGMADGSHQLIRAGDVLQTGAADR